MGYYILFNMALLLLGCSLPWLHPALFVVGLRGIDMIDGKAILILAFFGFLTGAYQLIWKKEGFYWLYGTIGLVTGVITGMDLYQFYQSRYPVGPGLYLAALGGLQLIGCYLVTLFRGGGR